MWMTSSAASSVGFGIARHVVADMVFHEFGHEAVDGAASGGEALEGFGAGFVLVEGAQDAFKLADDFLGAVNEVEFFRGKCATFSCLSTLLGYGIKVPGHSTRA